MDKMLTFGTNDEKAAESLSAAFRDLFCVVIDEAPC